MLVAQELENLRRKKGMKQGDFANYIESNPSTYNHIISGRRLPSLKFIEKLVNITETDESVWISLLEKDKIADKSVMLRNKMVHSTLSSQNLDKPETTAEFLKHMSEIKNYSLALAKQLDILNNLIEIENDKKELNKPYKDTCTATINLLIETGMIKSTTDIDDNSSVQELILAAAKKEVSKIFNK